MSRITKVVIAVLALLMTVASAAVLSDYIQSVTRLGKVVCATQDIQANTRITAEMLTVSKVPVSAIHSASTSDPSQMVGCYAKADIFAGEQVLRFRVLDKEAEPRGMLFKLDSQERIFSIPASMVAHFEGIMVPGDRLDALVTVKTSSGDHLAYVIGGIEVMAIRPALSEEGIGVSNNRGAVLLRTNPWQAEILALSLESGSVYFLLEPQTALPIDTGPVRLEDFLQSEGS